jgi:hypothetical protein
VRDLDDDNYPVISFMAGAMCFLAESGGCEDDGWRDTSGSRPFGR